MVVTDHGYMEIRLTQIILNYQEIADSIKKCRKCSLYQNRKNAVPGEGSIKAKLVFVGEGPGSEEDISGKPFVGQAGKFLTSLIESIGLKREKVYITNIVKCRPPHNRDPKPDEIEMCLPYLREQISLIKPKIIATLGNFALKTLVKDDLTIGRSHGKIYKKGKVCFIALYHPAAALYNPSLKRVLEKDFKTLGKFMTEEIN